MAPKARPWQWCDTQPTETRQLAQIPAAGLTLPWGPRGPQALTPSSSAISCHPRWPCPAAMALSRSTSWAPHSRLLMLGCSQFCQNFRISSAPRPPSNCRQRTSLWGLPLSDRQQLGTWGGVSGVSVQAARTCTAKDVGLAPDTKPKAFTTFYSRKGTLQGQRVRGWRAPGGHSALLDRCLTGGGHSGSGGQDVASEPEADLAHPHPHPGQQDSGEGHSGSALPRRTFTLEIFSQSWLSSLFPRRASSESWLERTRDPVTPAPLGSPGTACSPQPRSLDILDLLLRLLRLLLQGLPLRLARDPALFLPQVLKPTRQSRGTRWPRDLCPAGSLVGSNCPQIQVRTLQGRRSAHCGSREHVLSWV